MAQGGEHKMLFDIRGRRKRLVQVVYAMLAFIMVASLFFVVGPVDLGSLVGGGSTGSSSGAFEDDAQQIDRKLAKDPRNEQLLVRDVRAWATAGNAQAQRDPTTGEPTGDPQAAVEDFTNAGDAWLRYMKLNPSKPNPDVAHLAAAALLYSSTVAELDTRIKGAAEAQAIYAEARPSPGAYLELAQYRFLLGDVQGGQEAGRKAEQEAPATQRSLIEQTVTQYRKQGKQIRAQAKKASKLTPDTGGERALENPLGGLSGGGSGSGVPAP